MKNSKKPFNSRLNLAASVAFCALSTLSSFLFLFVSCPFLLLSWTNLSTVDFLGLLKVIEAKFFLKKQNFPNFLQIILIKAFSTISEMIFLKLRFKAKIWAFKVDWIRFGMKIVCKIRKRENEREEKTREDDKQIFSSFETVKFPL